ARAFIGNLRAEDRLADDGVGPRIFQGSVGIDLQIKPLSTKQRADVVSRSHAEFHERLTRRCGGSPKFDSSLRNAGTAAGSAVIRRYGGVSFNDRDSIHRNIEFFRHPL